MKRKPICNISLSGMQKDHGSSIVFDDEALLVQIRLPTPLRLRRTNPCRVWTEMTTTHKLLL